MKIGFNEGCNRFCENHSVLEDLDLCEKYGVDYIDIQSECLDREIAAGKYTIDDLAAWFADPKHHLKMLSYNALIFFNMKQTQEEKDAVMAKLDQIIEDCNKLQCKMIVVVPSMDLTVPATLDEIKADAVAVLKEMVKKTEPHGIRDLRLFLLRLRRVILRAQRLQKQPPQRVLAAAVPQLAAGRGLVAQREAEKPPVQRAVQRRKVRLRRVARQDDAVNIVLRASGQRLPDGFQRVIPCFHAQNFVFPPGNGQKLRCTRARLRRDEVHALLPQLVKAAPHRAAGPGVGRMARAEQPARLVDVPEGEIAQSGGGDLLLCERLFDCVHSFQTFNKYSH